MTERTDPMFYDLEIREVKTKKTNTAQVGCWWSGEHSIKGIRSMCDCQLGGYFGAKPHRGHDGKESWSNAFATAQHDYLKSHKCDHKPSRKFEAVSAHLPSGETVAL